MAILTVSTTIWAQKSKVSTAETSILINDFVNAKSNIDAAMTDPKSAPWPKTWAVAGDVYIKLEKAGKEENGGVQAVSFFEKAVALDTIGDEKGKGKGKYKKEIATSFTMASVDLVNLGILAFQAENYSKAAKIFDGYIQISENPYLFPSAPADTAIIYNAALAAYNAKEWDMAIKYFNKSIDLRYRTGDPILLLNNVFGEQKDLDKQIANLKNGFSIYPQDDRILAQLINIYLENEKNEEALLYLDEAIKNDPNNASFYYAKGVLYSKTGKFEESVSYYNQSLEKDPNNFNTLYNLGVLYYNKGVDKTNESNDIKDMKMYDIAKAEANSYFENSLPFMERAAVVNPTDKEVLTSLKGLYYRFNKMDKYNEVDARLKAL